MFLQLESFFFAVLSLCVNKLTVLFISNILVSCFMNLDIFCRCHVHFPDVIFVLLQLGASESFEAVFESGISIRRNIKDVSQPDQYNHVFLPTNFYKL